MDAAIERIFAMKSALTAQVAQPSPFQEVVLVRPIHGLLRMRGGRFCRKGLRIPSQGPFVACTRAAADLMKAGD
jgi:hypothetical protein